LSAVTWAHNKVFHHADDKRTDNGHGKAAKAHPAPPTEQNMQMRRMRTAKATAAKGDAQAQGLLQMAIWEREHRTADHATGRMAQKGGLRHRRRGARNHGDQQAHDRLREKEQRLKSHNKALQR
jgi:2-hydroxychromene-2-carboxylate isomerase